MLYSEMYPPPHMRCILLLVYSEFHIEYVLEYVLGH
jgi:hypothetical protein